MRFRRTSSIQLSPIKEIELAAARVPGVVSLAQGIPSFDTPEVIKAYVKEKLDAGEVARYSLSPGLMELRELVAETLARRNRMAAVVALERLRADDGGGDGTAHGGFRHDLAGDYAAFLHQLLQPARPGPAAIPAFQRRCLIKKSSGQAFVISPLSFPFATAGIKKIR